MLLGLKHVDLASSKQYQNKTRQKLSRLQKCAFDLLGVGLDIENYCTIRASPACQRRCLRFLSAL